MDYESSLVSLYCFYANLSADYFKRFEGRIYLFLFQDSKVMKV
jgi:hypothetical protein